MSDPSLTAGLVPLLDVLVRLGVPHYIGGSLASSAHGVARASIDADVVADLRIDHVPHFLEGLQEAYYVPEARVREATTRRGSFNVIHLATMLKVDVFLAKDRRFDRSALARACAEPIEAEPRRNLPLATAEDIVLAKLEWYRKGGEVSERQWTDVLGVLRARGPNFDERYARDHARELEVIDLLERALAEATTVP